MTALTGGRQVSELGKNRWTSLKWWSTFARHWNGTTLMSGSHDNEVILTTDAAQDRGDVEPGEGQQGSLQWSVKSQGLQITI